MATRIVASNQHAQNVWAQIPNAISSAYVADNGDGSFTVFAENQYAAELTAADVNITAPSGVSGNSPVGFWSSGISHILLSGVWTKMTGWKVKSQTMTAADATLVNGELTINKSGWWLLNASVDWANRGINDKVVVTLEHSSPYEYLNPIAGGPERRMTPSQGGVMRGVHAVSGAVFVPAGSKINIYAYQDTTSYVTVMLSSTFSAVRLGD